MNTVPKVPNCGLHPVACLHLHIVIGIADFHLSSSGPQLRPMAIHGPWVVPHGCVARDTGASTFPFPDPGEATSSPHTCQGGSARSFGKQGAQQIHALLLAWHHFFCENKWGPTLEISWDGGERRRSCDTTRRSRQKTWDGEWNNTYRICALFIFYLSWKSFHSSSLRQNPRNCFSDPRTMSARGFAKKWTAYVTVLPSPPKKTNKA